MAASPQTENGHTKIANELLEAIYKVPLSDYEHRIFWFIVRKTYGFKKKQDWISQKQIATELGIHKCHISRTIKKLLGKNMITNTLEKNKKIIGIQKDYEKWKLPKQVTTKSYLNRYRKLPKEVTKVTQTGNKKLPKEAHTKETLTKETIQKKLIQNTPYKIIIDNFNLVCISLPKMEILTNRRKIVMKSRFNKYGLDKIKDVFNKTEESNFLTNRNGENKNNWIANFDWILDENNMAKILEGNYDNRKGKKIDWDKFMGEDNAK